MTQEHAIPTIPTEGFVIIDIDRQDMGEHPYRIDTDGRLLFTDGPYGCIAYFDEKYANRFSDDDHLGEASSDLAYRIEARIEEAVRFHSSGGAFILEGHAVEWHINECSVNPDRAGNDEYDNLA